MENQTVSSKKIILSYGVIFGLTTIALSVIMYVTGLVYTMNWIAGTIGFILMIVFIILGIRDFKKQNGLFLSLSQALKIGVGITVVAALLGVIYQYVFNQFIDPDFMNKMLEISREQMLQKNPNMTQEQMDMAIEMQEKFSSPIIISAMTILWSCFLGLIISLVAGLIMKKTEDSF